MESASVSTIESTPLFLCHFADSAAFDVGFLFLLKDLVDSLDGTAAVFASAVVGGVGVAGGVSAASKRRSMLLGILMPLQSLLTSIGSLLVSPGSLLVHFASL